MEERKTINTTTRYLLKVKRGWFSHFIVFLNSCPSMKNDYYCETEGVYVNGIGMCRLGRLLSSGGAITSKQS